MSRAVDKSDGLLAKYLLLTAIIGTDWATRLDHKVATIIVERYRSDHGNARASNSYLACLTRADIKNVRISVGRLVEHGAFFIHREGKGTRPTEYVPNFSFAASGGAHAPATSGDADTPTCGGADAPTNGRSGDAETPQSRLPVPLTISGYGEEATKEPAAATPPPAPRPDRAGGSVPAGDFEVLWRAYGFKRGKAEARAAFDALSPSDERAAAMIEAARDWCAAWAEGGDAKTGRRTLASWLQREDFDCEPPRRYEKPTRQKRPTDDEERPQAPTTGTAGPPQAPKRHRVTITDAATHQAGADIVLAIVMSAEDGTHFRAEHKVQARSASEQEDGQRALARLCMAANLGAVEDAAELCGREIEIMAGPTGPIHYVPHLDCGLVA
ncbi:hypothetical protein SAMN06297251_12311 [Fulvimarina manganoxydans]|uniref:Helix-turn-helix domain-containing protein n=1 Tax=Fulvimarina manganoxydans TaxID=937218 RepID=A0A1W2E9V3_9HYPH|nr:hypothetical protein [Fulvimarina manganoxydans]SMD06445.1 hypothetical protein SAMN06297251_12311 [Fulvimarina manganoxydans]